MPEDPDFCLIEYLSARGLIHQTTPGLAEHLRKQKIAAYVGFDPSADSLHIGNLLSIILLIHLQKHGHKPILLVGGATGRIGDPSFKSQERALLDISTITHNATCIREQLSRFVDFSKTNPAKAELVNNLDWFTSISFIDFARDIGKHITVNYMLAKDSVKARIASEQGISFTEFCYQLMQGYDFYHLYQQKQCSLQIGGSDQWGNIITGVELIRRKFAAEAFGLTCPLLTRSDGQKFGKSEGQNIWLDARKTPPFSFYQFWLNASDRDCSQWIRLFTFLPLDAIASLERDHHQQPQKRILQRALAHECTALVHGREQSDLAEKTTALLFSDASLDEFLSLGEETFRSLCANVPTHSIASTDIEHELPLVTVLAQTGICGSKSEAKKAISSGSVLINKVIVRDVQRTLHPRDVLFQKYLLIQSGKKNFFLIEVQ